MDVKKIRYLFPRGSESFFKANSGLQTTEPECDNAQALGTKLQGTKKSDQRITVRYRLCLKRPYDWDNAAAATKSLSDAICRIGLIPGDEPWKIKLEIEQEKVDTNEQIELEITYPSCIALQSLMEYLSQSQSSLDVH